MGQWECLMSSQGPNNKRWKCRTDTCQMKESENSVMLRFTGFKTNNQNPAVQNNNSITTTSIVQFMSVRYHGVVILSLHIQQPERLGSVEQKSRGKDEVEEQQQHNNNGQYVIKQKADVMKANVQIRLMGTSIVEVIVVANNVELLSVCNQSLSVK
jgi:hypothetical protein